MAITEKPPQSVLRKWTPTAIDCYNRNCICNGCLIKEIKQNCKMKNVVLALYEKFGKPGKNEYK